MKRALASLPAIKLLHTIVWALLAGSVLAIPVLSWLEIYRPAGLLIAIVMVEVLVLALNGWKCPLTGVAERFTDDRRDNFDIYLPTWLAHYNKQIFGSLFVAGLLLTAIRWLI